MSLPLLQDAVFHLLRNAADSHPTAVNYVQRCAYRVSPNYLNATRIAGAVEMQRSADQRPDLVDIRQLARRVPPVIGWEILVPVPGKRSLLELLQCIVQGKKAGLEGLWVVDHISRYIQVFQELLPFGICETVSACLKPRDKRVLGCFNELATLRDAARIGCGHSVQYRRLEDKRLQGRDRRLR
jgi:hypothetical protein